ncbi:hypothetical protein [Hydrogenophaga sp.]|uniref:hypothetical protein n=1 Tax=Hydrogenophaga sp. TaxID=1904254 RepID=UPI0027164834|nr:hypothetical protein [Hydrogenophaga sp.]MDO8906537.1 hypothetical protein [Hydrogenophaga sp.]
MSATVRQKRLDRLFEAIRKTTYRLQAAVVGAAKVKSVMLSNQELTRNFKTNPSHGPVDRPAETLLREDALNALARIEMNSRHKILQLQARSRLCVVAFLDAIRLGPIIDHIRL